MGRYVKGTLTKGESKEPNTLAGGQVPSKGTLAGGGTVTSKGTGYAGKGTEFAINGNYPMITYRMQHLSRRMTLYSSIAMSYISANASFNAGTAHFT